MCPGPEGVRLRVGRPARGSSWLPAPPRATRSAPMAWAPRAPGGLRQLALRARNRRRGRCTPRRLHVPILRIVSWGWWGCRRRRALRASREALCKACFELLPRARVGLHAARTSLPPPPPFFSLPVFIFPAAASGPEQSLSRSNSPRPCVTVRGRGVCRSPSHMIHAVNISGPEKPALVASPIPART